MDRVELIPTSNDQDLQFLYRANYDEVNLLRRSIMSEIPCYAIHNVTSFTKTGYTAPLSSTQAEIGSRLGQCPIIQSLLPDNVDELVYRLEVINIQGIRIVTTRDIEGLAFAGEFEICRLKAGEHINYDLRLKKSTPRAGNHMKYMVASSVGVKEDPNRQGSIMTCELTGQYNAQDVLTLAFEGLPNTLTDVPENMFYRLAPKAL